MRQCRIAGRAHDWLARFCICRQFLVADPSFRAQQPKSSHSAGERALRISGSGTSRKSEPLVLRSDSGLISDIRAVPEISFHHNPIFLFGVTVTRTLGRLLGLRALALPP